MKNENKATTKTTVVPKLSMDPIDVAKRKLDEARIDYKRIREINAGPKTEKQANPARASAKEKDKVLKDARKAAVSEIKAAKLVIDAKRKQIKEINATKKALWADFKKTPRAPKNKAVKEAQIALLEAELAYQKACLG